MSRGRTVSLTGTASSEWARPLRSAGLDSVSVFVPAVSVCLVLTGLESLSEKKLSVGFQTCLRGNRPL